MPERPEVLEDVLLDLPLARHRSSDLVESWRFDVRDAFPRTEVDGHVEEGVREDLGHLDGPRKKPEKDGQWSARGDEKANEAKGKRREGRRDRTNRDPLLGINDKHLGDEILRIGRHIGRHDELPKLDLLEEDSDVFVVEGESTGEESEEDDSTRPDVRGSSVVGESLRRRRGEAKVQREIEEGR